MPATDFTGTPDSQMEHIMGLLENNPEFIPDVDQRRAFVAEYFRRKNGGSAAPSKPAATNVDRDLDAAASPLELDPAMVPRAPRGFASATDEAMVAPIAAVPGGGMGVTKADLPAYARRYRTAVRNTIDAGVEASQDARAAGWQDPEQIAYNAATGLPQEPAAAKRGVPDGADTTYYDSVTGEGFMGEGAVVNGVMVPGVRNALGVLETSIGDERRALEAADRSRRVAGLMKQRQEEDALYGYGVDGTEATPQQMANRVALQERTERMQQSSLYKRAQAMRLAQRAGVPVAQAAEMLGAEGGLQKLQAMSSQRYVDRQAQAQDLLRQRRLLAGGSQNLNSGNNAFFTALAMLEGVDPNRMNAQQQALMQMMPIDPRRAAVEAQQNAQLTQLGLRVATGQGFQPMTPEQRMLLGLKVDEAERELPPEERATKYRDVKEVHPSEVAMVDAHVSERYSAPGSIWGGGGLSSSFTTAEQQQTIDWLVNEKGYDPAKAQRIVDGVAQRRQSQSWFGNWE